jgi:hypothetical protein
VNVRHRETVGDAVHTEMVDVVRPVPGSNLPIPATSARKIDSQDEMDLRIRSSQCHSRVSHGRISYLLGVGGLDQPVAMRGPGVKDFVCRKYQKSQFTSARKCGIIPPQNQRPRIHSQLTQRIPKDGADPSRDVTADLLPRSASYRSQRGSSW